MEGYEAIPAGEWVYSLHPRPVAVIVSGVSWEKYSAMPASWITPVSRSPPVLAVAISPRRYTYAMIRESGEFGVCILPASMTEQVACLGSVSGRDVRDKLSFCRLGKMRAKRLRVPIIEGSLAVLECIAEKMISLGDHDLVVGRVVEAYKAKGLRLCPLGERVALHYCRNYYGTPSPINI